MKEYIEQQTKKFEQGVNELNIKRQEWANLEIGIITLLKSFVEETQLLNHYQNLQVLTDKNDPHNSHINSSYIQLSGSHITTGIGVVKKGNQNGFSIDYEEPSCLSIVQTPKGGVLFVIYPTASSKLKWKKDFIILRIFSRPSYVGSDDLFKAVEFYLRYSRYTSIYSKPTILDLLEFWCLTLRFSKIANWTLRGAAFTAEFILTAKTGIKF